MSIAYSEYYSRLSQTVSDTKLLVNGTSLFGLDGILAKVEAAHTQLLTEAPLRIVLIGEFSAGKSSLISALTGADLHIDADVATTSMAEYSWNGLSLVDTPGVQAEDTDTDHDAIAREATLGADLILFVVSNELFNQRLADHLNYVIGDAGLGLSKKTSIIVNKIDRETNADEMLLGEITKILGSHQDIPVYFCSASKYKQASQEESPIKERFERQSRFLELIKGINCFVDDAGANGRLSTPISVISECLEQIQLSVAETIEEKSKLELIRRQRRVLQKLQQRLAEIRKTWKQQAYSTVVSQANDSVEQLSELSKPEDLETLFEAGLKKADGEIVQLYEGLEIDVREALDQASAELDEIGNSSLGKQVAMFETERADKISITFNDTRPNDSHLTSKLFKSAAKPLQESLEAAAKNAKGMRDVYYKVGKALGKKFRPWEAIKAGEKIAKVAGKFGKAVPFIAAALDFYTQYREEKVKEEKERFLANLRMALRGAFVDQARVEADALEKTVVEISRGPVQESLGKLESEEDQIAQESKTNQSLLFQISKIRKSCFELRDEIYSGHA